MIFIKDLIKDTKNYFEIIKTNNYDLIFFSEGEHHLLFLKPLVEYLSNNFNYKILYVTLDENDKYFYKKEKINFFYFSSLSFAYTLLSYIRANLLITTINDIGNKGFLKKNKKIKKYVYIFHSLISTLSGYHYNSLKNYDVILCSAKYQISEIRFLEKKYNQTKKKLIPLGYSRFIDLQKNKTTIDKKTVLLAFTWGKDSFFSISRLEKLIRLLFENNYKVCIRPHPETLKRNRKDLIFLANKFKNNDLVIDDLRSDYYLYISSLLITDWSGIFFDYYFGLNKKTLFIKSDRKINNPDFLNYNLETFEEKIRNELSKELEISEILKKMNAEYITIDNNFLYKNFYRNFDRFIKTIIN